MTEAEYRRKRNNFAASDAPLEQRVRAIEELDEKYLASSTLEEARKQIEEGQADTSDLNGDE